MGDWIRWMQSDYSATSLEANYVLQHVLWNQFIDVDLTAPFDLRRIPKPGGRVLRSQLRSMVLGEGT